MKSTRFIVKNLWWLRAVSLLLITAALRVPADTVPATDLTIKYSQPASRWTEALPVGNGRLGALVFGGVTEEHLQLNEATLWSGAPREWNNPGAKEVLAQVRAAIFAGDYVKAGELCKKMQGPGNNSYSPLGDLRLSFLGDEASVTHYERILALDRAVATVRYQMGNSTFTREVFSSYPDQVMVVRLTCDQPGQIHFTATADSWLPHAFAADGTNTLVMTGGARSLTVNASTNFPGTAFGLHVCVLADGGTVACDGTMLAVTNVNAVTLLVTDSSVPLELARKKSYATLLARHEADYQKLFRSGDFYLSSTPGANGPTTAEGLDYFGQSQTNLEQAVLLYKYGCYLSIADLHAVGDEWLTNAESANGVFLGRFADRQALTAEISAMLLKCDLTAKSSSEGKDIPVLELLPALPPLWPYGHVTGLHARGGFTVDMEWKIGRVVNVTIVSTGGTTFEVRTGNLVKLYTLKRGRSIILDAGLEKWSE